VVKGQLPSRKNEKGPDHQCTTDKTLDLRGLEQVFSVTWQCRYLRCANAHILKNMHNFRKKKSITNNKTVGISAMIKNEG
jgi:hypothetical protein